MKDASPQPYPGSNASPAEIVALAEEYRFAAKVLMERRRKGDPLSHAPARLCAIHAIELYLNAFLLNAGATPEAIRGNLHNLERIAEHSIAEGLILRKLTRSHLVSLAANREYLVSRYGPEMSGTLSQINRLMATLEEIAKKVKSGVIG